LGIETKLPLLLCVFVTCKYWLNMVLSPWYCARFFKKTTPYELRKSWEKGLSHAE